ncbi:hypothetical protein OFB63_36585, partial [Escherichia coli]|nr:hypothetical protein [Escherichia coli]
GSEKTDKLLCFPPIKIIAQDCKGCIRRNAGKLTKTGNYGFQLLSVLLSISRNNHNTFSPVETITR